MVITSYSGFQLLYFFDSFRGLLCVLSWVNQESENRSLGYDKSPHCRPAWTVTFLAAYRASCLSGPKKKSVFCWKFCSSISVDRLFGNAKKNQALAANSTTPEFPACPCAVHEKQEFKQKITGKGNNRKCHLHSWQSNQSHLASYTKCISWELKKNCERLQFQRLLYYIPPVDTNKSSGPNFQSNIKAQWIECIALFPGSSPETIRKSCRTPFKRNDEVTANTVLRWTNSESTGSLKPLSCLDFLYVLSRLKF